MRRPGSPSPACSWSGQARGDGDPQQVSQQHRVGQLAADPAARQPAAGRAPHLARPRRLGRERQAVPYPRDRGEGDGVARRRPCTDSARLARKDSTVPEVSATCSARSSRRTISRASAAAGRGHLARSREVAGQARVDQIRRDAAAPQQPAARFQYAEFTAPGEITGGRAVRLQTEQRRAPAAYGEAGLGVEEGGARGGRALGAGQLGLEGAEAQLRSQDAVAVLVHEGRRFDHPGSPWRDRVACYGPNG